jgi:SAM-dependent methyltransferase
MDALVDRLLRVVAGVVRLRPRRTPTQAVRLNLGSGPQGVPGWIGIDASAHLLARWLPAPFLRRVLRHTMAGEAVTDSLRHGRFVFWDLKYGIPFADGSAEAIYSSHMLEHMNDREAATLLRECHRVASRGGVVRIVVPVVETDAEDEYERARRYLHSHRSRWNSEKLRELLEHEGFARVDEQAYRIGRCPDLELLERRPDSLFVEATR